MMSIHIDHLEGELTTIESKSILHRYLIIAAFSDQTTYIDSTLASHDIKATCSVLRSMGASIEMNDTGYIVCGPITKPQTSIDAANCYDSGSTLRFLIPFAFLLDNSITFTGSEQLARRSLKSYIDFFEMNKIKYEYHTNPLSLKIESKLNQAHVEIDGSHSSQFVSGLVMFMAFSDTLQSIRITGSSVSTPYIDLTINALAKFGIHVECIDSVYTIKERSVANTHLKVEKDLSQAAFFLVANKLGGDIEMLDLVSTSLQADVKIFEILDSIEDDLIGDYTYDLENYPDLGPILMVLGSAIQGSLTLLNTQRLFDKECNRLDIMLTNLDKMRVKYVLKNNALTIFGQHLRYPGGFEITTANDHRIIMAMSIASMLTKAPLQFQSIAGIEKSYPHFFDHIQQLGGELCRHSD